MLDKALPEARLFRRASTQGSNGASGQRSEPGEEEAPSGGEEGTFDGVYQPVVSTMWGVIIFIRFGAIVGYAGWVRAVGLCCFSAVLQAFTTLSMAALVSNRGGGAGATTGGVFGLLCSCLGGAIAAVIGLTYYVSEPAAVAAACADRCAAALLR